MRRTILLVLAVLATVLFIINNAVFFFPAFRNKQYTSTHDMRSLVHVMTRVAMTKAQLRQQRKEGVPEYYVPRDYRFIINPDRTCKNQNGGQTDVTILVTVPSAASHFKHRQLVRETWGKQFQDGGKNRLLFFLGDNQNNETLLSIKNESDVYSDIVQHSHVDSYNNLSIKSVSVLRWVATYCRHVTYVFKVDDDTLVNKPYLLNRLSMASKAAKYFFLCYVYKGSPVVREPGHRWYISWKDYGSKNLPPYCGGFYAFTANMAPALYQAAKQKRLFRLEDVFISSMVAKQTGLPIRLVHHKFFSLWRAVDLKKPCDFKKHVVLTKYNATEIRTMWTQYTTKCR